MIKQPTDDELRASIGADTSVDDIFVQHDLGVERGDEGDGAYVPCVVWVSYNDVPGYERVDYETED